MAFCDYAWTTCCSSNKRVKSNNGIEGIGCQADFPYKVQANASAAAGWIRDLLINIKPRIRINKGAGDATIITKVVIDKSNITIISHSYVDVKGLIKPRCGLVSGVLTCAAADHVKPKSFETAHWIRSGEGTGTAGEQSPRGVEPCQAA